MITLYSLPVLTISFRKNFPRAVDKLLTIVLRKLPEERGNIRFGLHEVEISPGPIGGDRRQGGQRPDTRRISVFTSWRLPARVCSKVCLSLYSSSSGVRAQEQLLPSGRVPPGTYIINRQIMSGCVAPRYQRPFDSAPRDEKPAEEVSFLLPFFTPSRGEIACLSFFPHRM